MNSTPDPSIFENDEKLYAYLKKKHGLKTEEEELLEDGDALMSRLVAKITAGARNRSTVGWKSAKLEVSGVNAFKRMPRSFSEY